MGPPSMFSDKIVLIQAKASTVAFIKVEKGMNTG